MCCDIDGNGHSQYANFFVHLVILQIAVLPFTGVSQACIGY